METDFWHSRWENNLTGFHLNEVNPYLKAHFVSLGLKSAARIFVPLCGKSLDLMWLAEKGYEVVGVELSPIAVEAFFTENNMQAQLDTVDGLSRWQSGNITVFCGDFFNLSVAVLGQVDAVYDRASLIALPVSMRKEYADKLTQLAENAPKLLITLEYQQSKMDGPPFSVTENEITALYGEHYQIKCLSAQDVLDNNPKFKERGLTYMNESCYLLLAK